MYPFKTFPERLAELPLSSGPSVGTMALPFGGRGKVLFNATTLKRVERSAQTAPATNAAQPTPAASQEERAAFRKRWRALLAKEDAKASQAESKQKSGLASQIRIGGNVVFNAFKDRETPAPAKGRFAGRIKVSRYTRGEQAAPSA